jgi:hypothetical protein
MPGFGSGVRQMSDDPSLRAAHLTPPLADGSLGLKERTMKTLYACLAASVAFGLPLFASAQSPDAKYCSALAARYSGFLAAAKRQSPEDPQTAGARAGMEQCRAGNAAAGIPLLESGLRQAGLDLPPRDSTWTFVGVTHGPKR